MVFLREKTHGHGQQCGDSWGEGMMIGGGGWYRENKW